MKKVFLVLLATVFFTAISSCGDSTPKAVTGEEKTECTQDEQKKCEKTCEHKHDSTGCCKKDSTGACCKKDSTAQCPGHGQ